MSRFLGVAGRSGLVWLVMFAGCSSEGSTEKSGCRAPGSGWVRSAAANGVDVRAILPRGRCAVAIAGVDLRAATPRGVVMRTEDGGRNWITTLPAGTEAVDRLAGQSGKLGWALGSTHTAGSILLSTRDRGLHWRRVALPPGFIASDLAFASNNAGWVVGRRASGAVGVGAVLRTVDAGAHWRQIRLPVGLASLTSISRADSGRIWITGREAEPFGRAVVLTSREGRVWRESHFGRHDLLAIFARGATAWVIGARGSMGRPSVRKGILFGTRDEGRHWRAVGIPRVDSVNGAFFLGERGWLTVSRNGHGSILAMRSGGAWRAQPLPCRTELCLVGAIAGTSGRLWVGGDGLLSTTP